MDSFQTIFFKKNYWSYLVLLITPILLYKKSLSFGFSPLDEQWMIEDNAWFLTHWSNLKTVFTGSTALMMYYRPFLVASTMIDFHIGKLDPFIYHLDTLIWHLGCILLLFEFLLQYQTKIRIAFFLSLIFAVHPIMLHAVAWIPGRNDSMLCFFMLASIISLNKYIDQNKIRFFLYHILFFWFALFTKENAIVFPIIYLAIIYLRQKENKKLLWISMVLSLLILCSWVILWKSFVSVQAFPGGPVVETLRNTIEAYLLYLGKTLFPFQQSVFPVLKYSSVLPGIFTLILFILLWWRFKPKDQKAAYLGGLMFFILLIIPIIFIAMKSDGEFYEHRLYAPMIGVVLFLSQLKFTLKPSFSSMIFICIAAVLMLVTYKRMDVYKSKISFLDAAIKSDPDYYFFHLRQGQLFDKQGDYEKAIDAFNEALKRSPRYGQAYFDRGNAYFSLGDKAHTLDDYNSAITYSKPKLKEKIMMQRCIALDIFNEPDLAMKDLETLKVCCKQMIEPNFEKELTKKVEIENWNRKVREEPRNPELYIMRGMFFIEKHMVKEAVADFKKATELAPNNSEYKELFRRASIEFAPALEKTGS
jgi:protein O-mannosyl-transferase